jgi:stearoyl-CoA desaturase (delta-9 desaturase)
VTTTNTVPAATLRAEGRVNEAKPLLLAKRPSGEAALVYAFTLLPMLALVVAVPLAWGWGCPGSTPGWPPRSTSSPGSE